MFVLQKTNLGIIYCPTQTFYDLNIQKHIPNYSKTLGYSLEPMNVRLHHRREKLWYKMEKNLNDHRDHNWWSRAAEKVAQGESNPLYVPYISAAFR